MKKCKCNCLHALHVSHVPVHASLAVESPESSLSTLQNFLIFFPLSFFFSSHLHFFISGFPFLNFPVQNFLFGFSSGGQPSSSSSSSSFSSSFSSSLPHFPQDLGHLVATALLSQLLFLINQAHGFVFFPMVTFSGSSQSLSSSSSFSSSSSSFSSFSH